MVWGAHAPSHVAVGAPADCFFRFNQIHIAEPPAGFSLFRPPSAALPSIALLAGLVIAFGCAPGWLPGNLSIVPNPFVFQI
jgi:hypothetical protein